MFSVNKLNVSVVFEFHFVGFLCKTFARLFLSVHFLFQVLKFDSGDLRKNLTFCEPDAVTVTEESDFQHYEDAQNLVARLWPLKKEVSLQQRIRGNKSIINNRLSSCFTSWHSRWAVNVSWLTFFINRLYRVRLSVGFLHLYSPFSERLQHHQLHSEPWWRLHRRKQPRGTNTEKLFDVTFLFD